MSLYDFVSLSSVPSLSLGRIFIIKPILIAPLCMNATLIILFIILAVLYFDIQTLGAVVVVAPAESKLLQEQQNFIAKLTGDNTIPSVNTNATGITKFETKSPNSNEVYYEINLTNLRNDVARVEVHLGKANENGPSVVTLYQTTVSLPSEICCRSATSESERTKFFFNGTISTQDFEFGALTGSKNIADLVRHFDSGNAYVEVYTHNPISLSFSGMDSEIRGQIMPLASNYTTITKLQQ